MKFRQLYKLVVEKKTPGKIRDPKKYIATGPKDLSKTGGEENPVKFRRDLKRELLKGEYDTAKDVGTGPLNMAKNNIKLGMQTAIALPETYKQIAQIFKEYNENARELKDTISKIERLKISIENTRDEERLRQKKAKLEDLKKYLSKFRIEVDERTGELFNELKDVVKESSKFLANYIKMDEGVNDLKSKKGVTINSFEELTDSIMLEDEFKHNFLQRVYKGEGDGLIDSFQKIYDIMNEEKEHPMFYFTKFYKDSMIKASEKGFIENPKKLVDFLLDLRKKRPSTFFGAQQQRKQLGNVKNRLMRLIKKGKIEEAQELATEYEFESSVMNSIELFKNGEITEADLIKNIVSYNGHIKEVEEKLPDDYDDEIDKIAGDPLDF